MLHPRITEFLTASQGQPTLFAFDKDGTLIDFAAMWSVWAADLARALSERSGMPLLDRLGTAWGFDPVTLQVDAAGPLSIGTVGQIEELACKLLIAGGYTPQRANALLNELWYWPDPVTLAQPTADLPLLFATLRNAGAVIGVATLDTRAPTLATLTALGVADFVTDLACGDDGLPHKPAPDALLALCHRLGVEPRHMAVMGDTPADMRMGRAAGAGLLIGVLTGTGTSDELATEADVVLDSIGEMLGSCVP